MSKYGVFSCPFFSIFELKKTPYFDTFHTVCKVQTKLYYPTFQRKSSKESSMVLIRNNLKFYDQILQAGAVLDEKLEIFHLHISMEI